MIDTHSHIYSEEFDLDRVEVIRNAKLAGVECVVLANVDNSTVKRLDNATEQYPDFCVAAMGLHPTSVDKNFLLQLQTIKEALVSKKYCAVGEIGLDLYWSNTFISQQTEAFEEQLKWALELGLPVIIHIRKAFAEVFKVLKQFGNNQPKGVFHCYSGGIEEAKKAISLGYKLGIGGVITYKNTNLPQIIKQIGVDHILLETDAPYLSPVPFRGKRNEPKHMALILEKVSEIFSLQEEKVSEITSLSAKELFF